MTTTAARPTRPVDPAGRRRSPRGAAGVRPLSIAGLRASLDRPLTSYYLLVGASGLLLTLGLVMVLSSSSVWSYEFNGGNSYATFLKQLTWVVLAAPVRAGSRCGCRTACCASSPGRR